MNHPSLNYSFDELIRGLDENVALGMINKKEHPELTGIFLYDYTKDCTFNKAWNPFTLMARGLIVDMMEKRVVAHTFPKFFNYGELGATLPNMSFTTSEKMDGSMGICAFYRNRWRVSTRGSFTSDQAIWGDKWLHGNADIDRMVPSCTYLFEIIYPENRIVVKYDFEGLALLGVYMDGVEISPINGFISQIAETLKVRVAKQHEFASINDILPLLSTLSGNEEGFVVRFENGTRVKFKGDAYCKLHALISNITPLGVWRLFENDINIDLTEIMKDIPEEFHGDFNNIVLILKSSYHSILAKAKMVAESTDHMSDKEVGLRLNELVETYGYPAKMVFSMRKKTSVHRNIYMNIRPLGNKLEGYRPSISMNKFAETVE